MGPASNCDTAMLGLSGPLKNIQIESFNRYQMKGASILSVVIDPQSTVAKYQQLQSQIEFLITEGRLLPGQKLPSSRELVQLLRISRTSVLRAIDNLIAEGVLVSKPKKGVFVAAHLPLLSRSKAEPVALSKQTDDNLLSFDSGANTEAFPHSVWAKCMKRSWQKPGAGIMEGHFEHGVPALKRQICSYLKQLRGLQCKPSQIIVTAGNRDALSILHHALLTRDAHKVYLEQACYPPIYSLMHFLNSEPIGALLDDEGAVLPDPRPTEHCLAILTPCRQYPLGMPMSSARRQRWLAFLKQRRDSGVPFWCIEDDYDNEFVYQGRGCVPLMQQDTSSSVFFVGSFSKVLFRGLRLGFVVAPEKEAERVRASQRLLGMSCSTALQPALADFMASGEFTTHLRKMRRLYGHKRHLLVDYLSPLSPFYTWENVSGGMHICLKLKPAYHSFESAIKEIAGQMGVQLNALSGHFPFDNKQFGFILGFTKLSEDELKQAVSMLIKATLRVLKVCRN